MAEKYSDDEEDWTDITHIVKEAASLLSNSNPLLCNSSTFRLHDAMHALEIKHPIMDRCEIPISYYTCPLTLMCRQDTDRHNLDPNVVTVPPRQLPTGLKDSTSSLPWETLTLRHARIICIENFIRLESFFSGSDILESTYTSLYAHDGVLKDMRQDVMSPIHRDNDESSPARWAVYASSLLLVKLCEITRSIVIDADIYEEEDFSMYSGGKSFRFFPLLGTKEELILDVSRALNVLSSYATESNFDAKIIVSLIRFQINLYICSFTMSMLTKTSVIPDTHKVKFLVAESVRIIDDVLSLCETVGATTFTDDDTLIMSRTFDVHMNRPLLRNTPIRRVNYSTVNESLEKMRTIMKEIGWAVCDVLLYGSTMLRLQSMLERVSKSKTNILNRSLLLLNLYFDDLILGQYDLAIFIIQHLHGLGVPQSLTSGAISFVDRLAKPIFSILKLFTLNRNRQVTFIDACILTELNELQLDAAATDYAYREELKLGSSLTPFLTNVVIFITTQIMELHVSLSIELGLFSQHYDLGIMYWYLDYLLSTKINLLHIMRQNIRREKVLGKDQLDGKVCHTIKNKSCSQVPASGMLSPFDAMRDSGWDYYLDEIKMKQLLSRGIMRFLVALNQAGILKPVTYCFTSHGKMFEQRFASFQIIRHPAPLSYDDYLHVSDHSLVGSQELIDYAATCFKMCKALVEQSQSQMDSSENVYNQLQKVEWTNMTRVCIGNSVFMQKLVNIVKAGDKDGSNVSFDFQSLKQFCIIRIT